MTQADLLATSNSTFSVSAAMLSKSSEGESRFWRPVPSEGALVAFDPWDCQPLLSVHGRGGGRTVRRKDGVRVDFVGVALDRKSS